ncbi:hypothetical protein BGZ70_001763 [Mortierella alpina]|uniref:Rab-GAP TBC domain-containing protein n=1 Tax=Mortierella alpina TaxID=64518 RepID=A0A9P6IVQ4_MORAP|nr:hypothetical protein BGZ70_001763 [Mortierella alpina]
MADSAIETAFSSLSSPSTPTRSTSDTPQKHVSIHAPLTKSPTAPELYHSKPSAPTPPADVEDHVAAFKKMLDDILDNASAEALSQGFEPSLGSSRLAGGLSTSTSSSNFLSSSSSAAADRARLNRSTTLGFLLPQPKIPFAKLKTPHSRSDLATSTVDVDLLHKLEEQNNSLPAQDSTSFLLARLERQNGLLDTDPKSVCIESNALKGNLNTLHQLISDSTSLTGQNGPASDSTPTSSNKALAPQAGDGEIDWEFWGMLVQDYNAVAGKLPHLLAARVRQGLPAKLRGLIWQSMSQASSTYLETMYTQLLKEHSPYERIIQRDLARTFPQIDMFKEEGGKGQEMLRNVLKAYSLYDPHVGYCQGLGFLVGPLLMNMGEKEAFCVFVRLMETYDMRTMFTLNMEGLQLRLYQFSALLSEHLPMLHAHLSFHAINAAMYASQWFLSLFAYTYPLPLVLRIYDVVFTEGAPETIMRVAVAFLKKNEERLMQLQEFEDLLDVLSTKLYDVYEDNAGDVIRDAMTLSNAITKEKLDALAMAYIAELEDQQKRAEEVTSTRFKDRFGASTKAASKGGESKVRAKESNSVTKAAKPKMSRGSSRLSIAASFGSTASLLFSGPSSSSSDDESVEAPSTAPTTPPAGQSDAMLLDQIQDLAKALSSLQRDHVDVTEGLEIDSLRKKVADLERQQNRASMMSAISPSVMSDTASSVMMSSPRTITHEDGKMRSSSSWSRHSQEEDTMFGEGETIHKTSSVSSLNVTQDELVSRLANMERELAHVTSELVRAKVSALEAMNEAESQKAKTQNMEEVLLESKEAVGLLQQQHVALQDLKMTMTMDFDAMRHERDSLQRELTIMRPQFEETKRLWLEGQVERHTLQEKVKELEMNAAFTASTASLGRGRSMRKSLNDVAMMSLMTSRSGSPSPRASTQMTPLSETAEVMLPPHHFDSRRGSRDSLESSSGRAMMARRGSSDTLGSMNSNSNGRESTSSARPAAMVRKGWPSEKAASAGVVPSTPVTTTYGTRKFMVATPAEGCDSASKLKRNASNRNSILGALSFRRSTSDNA